MAYDTTCFLWFSGDVGDDRTPQNAASELSAKHGRGAQTDSMFGRFAKVDTRTIARSVQPEASQVLGRLSNQSRLYLVGHCTAGTALGNWRGDELITFLNNNGLQARCYVNLVACNAGGGDLARVLQNGLNCGARVACYNGDVHVLRAGEIESDSRVRIGGIQATTRRDLLQQRFPDAPRQVQNEINAKFPAAQAGQKWVRPDVFSPAQQRADSTKFLYIWSDDPSLPLEIRQEYRMRTQLRFKFDYVERRWTPVD